MKKYLPFIASVLNPLFIIIAAAFLLRVINLGYNSPFVDEAIYLRLGRQVLEGRWQEVNPFSWVGGLPLFYPALSAIAGFFGGIYGARFLNVLLGTFSVFLIYHLGKNLNLSADFEKNEFIAGISAIILAITGIPVYLSRIATYDMLSSTLFLTGLVMLFKVLNLNKSISWQRENLFFSSALFFFFSFLAKYITLALLPLIIIFALVMSKNRNGLFRICLKYFVLPLTAFVAIYSFRNISSLLEFYRNQVPSAEKQYAEIFREFIHYTLPVLPLSLPGLAVLYFKRKLITLFLIFGALLLPLFHLFSNNLNSAHQHVFLVLVFLIIPVGYLLSLINSKRVIFKTIVSFSVLLSVYFLSYPQTKSLEASWPNSDVVMTYLRENSTPSDIILSSEDDITVLALPHVPENNIFSFWNFDYLDLPLPGSFSTAIADGHFSYILLNNELTGEIPDAIRSAAPLSYEKVFDEHPYIIYKRAAS